MGIDAVFIADSSRQYRDPHMLVINTAPHAHTHTPLSESTMHALPQASMHDHFARTIM